MITKSLLRNNTALAVLIVFCLSIFFLRLKFFSDQDSLLGYDSANYAAVADNIVKGRGFYVDFVLSFYKKYPEISHPEDRRLSIYSLLMAFVFLFAGKTILTAKLLNIFLGSLSLPLSAYALARSLQIPKVTGLFSGFSVVVVHNVAEQAHTALADLLFAQFFLLFFIALMKSTDTPRWHYAAGIFAGLSFLSKTQGIFLLPVWCFYGLIFEKNQAVFKTRYLIVGFAMCSLLMMPFLFRNYYLFKDPFYTTIKYNAPFEELWDTKPLAFLERSLKVYWDDNLPEYMVEITNKGLFGNLEKVIRQIINAVHLIGYPFLALSLVSVLLLHNRRVVGLLSAVVVYILLISAFFAFHSRYEIPVIPLLLVLSWGALYYMISKMLDYCRFRGNEIFIKTVAGCILCFIIFFGVHKNDLKRFIKGLDRPPLAFQESLINLARWAGANLPPSAVVMTHDPPLFNFISGLQAVEIPFDDADALKKVISHYHVSHIIPWTVDKERYAKLAKSGRGGNVNILLLNPSIPYGNLYDLAKAQGASLYSNRNLAIYALDNQLNVK